MTAKAEIQFLSMYIAKNLDVGFKCMNCDNLQFAVWWAAVPQIFIGTLMNLASASIHMHLSTPCQGNNAQMGIFCVLWYTALQKSIFILTCIMVCWNPIKKQKASLAQYILMYISTCAVKFEKTPLFALLSAPNQKSFTHCRTLIRVKCWHAPMPGGSVSEARRQWSHLLPSVGG